jgi:glutaredoxin
MTLLKAYLKSSLCLLAFFCAAWPAHAVYKIVGPDGKVTYTDRKPNEPGNPRSATTTTNAGGTAADLSALPYELRQTAQRFAVVLYTTPSCSPCETARQLLIQRGVPYSEKTVQTTQDNEALQQAVGARELPVLTVGSQVLKGLQTSQWHSYLDTAGYPKESALPARFSNGQSSPLTTPAAPAPKPATPASAPTPPSAAPTPSSQPGFRF